MGLLWYCVKEIEIVPIVGSVWCFVIENVEEFLILALIIILKQLVSSEMQIVSIKNKNAVWI